MKIWVIEPDETCVTTLLKDHIKRMGQEMPLPESVGSDEGLREEKRLYVRKPCFLLADYVTQGCAYTAFIKNVSPDGAFIESPRPVPTESEIALVISPVDEHKPIKVAAEVVRVEQQGIGVRFIPLSQGDFVDSILSE
jgi:hypothetical protein